MKKQVWIVLILLTAIGIVSLILWQSYTAQAQVALQEKAVVKRALEIAHERGLQGVRPDGLAVKHTTMAEWFRLNAFTPAPGAEKFGLDPKRRVWIVAMKGNVDWSGPGRVGGAGDHFDNLAVVLDEATLKHLGTLSVARNQPLPLGLQR